MEAQTQLEAACRDRHVTKVLKRVVTNMQCLTQLGQETGVTPYLGQAQCLRACFLRAQQESSRPPKECNLESAWSYQASTLQATLEICSRPRGQGTLSVGYSPEVKFVVKNDPQVALTQLRNESVTTRSRPFANVPRNYMRPALRAFVEPGTTQKADGLTKILSGIALKNYASDLGLAHRSSL